MEGEALDLPASNALTEKPRNGQPETITGVMAGFSLQQSLASLSQSVKQVQVQFYTIEKILGSSVKEGSVQSEDALTCIKSAKTLFSEKAESSRKLLSSSYRHCGDLMLAYQMPVHEQRMLMEGNLDSAKVLSREFSQYIREFGGALTQFELQKPSLLAPQSGESYLSPSESTCSTKNAVDNLFSSLHSMQTYLNEIIAFWDDHAEVLSNNINPSSSSNSNRSSPDNHDLAQTWLGYQRALLDASSSIAESVDAMAVEPAVHPRPNPRRVPSIAQEEHGILNALQWFWRRITFTQYRVR